MPTNLLHTTNSFLQEDVIHASDVGMQSRRALTVDDAKVMADAGGKKIVRPGLILYKISGATKHRVGLRATLAAAVTASSTTSLNLGDIGKIYQSKAAQYFAPGDVVKVLRPFATVTLALTWADDDTLTLLINGHTRIFTPGSATLATGVATVATAINADPVLSKLVTAIPADAILYLFSKSLEPFSLSVVGDGTAGDGTATASTVLSGVTVGTIDTAGVNVTAGTVTLAAAAAVTLPIGAPVGVDGEPWGLILGAHDAGKADNDIAGFTGGAMYGDRIPYWDGDIAAALNNITFV